ncbi:glycosyltransferase family 4 protein [Paracoccus tegillarcae]|uniref:Colanic acid biosynthesis glycosyltransferase WcaL n=1 Tax=Paracoccus tegillarcae TaxID=1529068 RepID=A0A2K9EII1_9RHOB|nr:glycosyltransferase family 4 protein [Paracoccus tegillarcae]AUH34793.1 colanic acid biosynthesis glycosyltransferase WcaL [Paracoccus tegillarcae]
MRVAYLINQYPKVSHSFIRREILALERQGVDVHRMALRGWDAPLVDDEDVGEQARTSYTLRDGVGALVGSVWRQLRRDSGALWRAVRAASAMSRNGVRPWPYHMVYVGHACRIMDWLQDEPADHLQAHFGTNTAEIALLVKLLGGPSYSFTVHGMDEADNAQRLHFQRKIGGARFVVAISGFSRSQLMRHVTPDLWDKIKVVHCGLDDVAFAPAPPPPDDAGFLCIGRLSPEKGHLILLDAFAAMHRERPDLHLVLAGDGDMRPEIEDRIAQLALAGSVRITGWISADQVREELAACHTLVQPSFIEGLPVVIMEAMAAGRPVISTYVGGIAELVLPGQTGWLVAAGDAEALKLAMQEALDLPEDQRDRISTASRQRARERHHIDREAAKLRALYSDGKTEA